jgi:predicted Zn-dependent peptidase
MFEELREKRGLTYYVSAGSDQYTDSGYFFANAGVEHKNLEKTIKLILKEFKKVVEKKIPEKEILKAKEYIKGTTSMSLESSSAIASFLGNQELFRKEIRSPKEIFKKIDAVTAEELQQIAIEIFKNENLNLTIIGPHQKNLNLEKCLNF